MANSEFQAEVWQLRRALGEEASAGTLTRERWDELARLILQLDEPGCSQEFEAAIELGIMAIDKNGNSIVDPDTIDAELDKLKRDLEDKKAAR